MGISQPALSHAIKRLEDELGTKLLHREKTGVRLTRSGELFAGQVKGLIEQWEKLATSVKSTEVAISGHFKIGCHPSVAIYSLPLFLRKLQINYPELSLSLKHGPSKEIANDVIEWRIDFGIVINPPQHPDLVILNLGKDEVTLWYNPNIDVPNTLIYDPLGIQSQSILKQLARKKLKFSNRIETSNMEVIQALTLSGCGVGILPTRVATTKKGSPLKQYGSNSPRYQDQLSLIYRSGTQSHAAGKAIISSILEAQI